MFFLNFFRDDEEEIENQETLNLKICIEELKKGRNKVNEEEKRILTRIIKEKEKELEEVEKYYKKKNKGNISDKERKRKEKEERRKRDEEELKRKDEETEQMKKKFREANGYNNPIQNLSFNFNNYNNYSNLPQSFPRTYQNTYNDQMNCNNTFGMNQQNLSYMNYFPNYQGPMLNQNYQNEFQIPVQNLKKNDLYQNRQCVQQICDSRSALSVEP